MIKCHSRDGARKFRPFRRRIVINSEEEDYILDFMKKRRKRRKREIGVARPPALFVCTYGKRCGVGKEKKGNLSLQKNSLPEFPRKNLPNVGFFFLRIFFSKEPSPPFPA